VLFLCAILQAALGFALYFFFENTKIETKNPTDIAIFNANP